jgi:hypothetical protein
MYRPWEQDASLQCAAYLPPMGTVHLGPFPDCSGDYMTVQLFIAPLKNNAESPYRGVWVLNEHGESTEHEG